MRIIAAAALVAALAACSTAQVGQEFTWEQVQGIKPGMTIAEVQAVLGQPGSTAITPQGTVMSWVYVPSVRPVPFTTSPRIETRQVSIVFQDGRVTQALPSRP